MNVAQVQFQAGLTALSQNHISQALSAFESAAKLAPRAAPAHHMVGIALQRLGRLAEAEKAISRAIELNPKEPDFFSNRALVKCGQERFDRAIFDAKAALSLDPAHIGGLCNLGLAQQGAKQYAAAAATFTRLIKVAPNFASAYDNASLAVRSIEDPDAGLVAATAFAAAAPDSSIAHIDLSGVLSANGEVARAAAELERAVALAPTDFRAHSRRLFNLNYLEAPSTKDRAAMVGEFTKAAVASIVPGAHQPDAGSSGKTLRLGFVSADLREHSVSYFLVTVLPALRSRGLQLVAYSNVKQSDALTERLKTEFDEWRDIRETPDETVGAQIAADRIDILLDLSGHTGGNRQRLMAMRPAPVSVAWLGFSATTGNPGIDYVLGDGRVLSPESATHFTERPLRMPHGYLCFSPPGTEPGDAPGSGPMTFGSFNTLNKLSDRTVAMWSKILAAVPGSELLLKTKALDSTEIRQRTSGRFVAHGIDPERVVLVGHTATRDAHLQLYSRIHLALDPWPYSGTTTTMEALSMGVPVLTLDEGRFISRVSASLLDTAGLDHWIACDEAAYIEKAVTAATDITSLVAMRSGFRQQVLRSPLYDSASFAADFDAVMRGIWRDWCAGVGNKVN